MENLHEQIGGVEIDKIPMSKLCNQLCNNYVIRENKLPNFAISKKTLKSISYRIHIKANNFKGHWELEAKNVGYC